MTETRPWQWIAPSALRSLAPDAILTFLDKAAGRGNDTGLLRYRRLQTLVHAGMLEDAVRLGRQRRPGQSDQNVPVAALESLVAQALIRLERHDEALAWINAGLACAHNPELRGLRIRTLLKAGRRPEAVSELAMLRSQADAVLCGRVLELALEEWSPAQVLAQLDRSMQVCPVAE